MKLGLCALALVVAVLLASAVVAAPWYFNFHLEGTMMNHPAQYSGIFTSGADGTIEFTLTDTGWPDPSDPDARFAYIWSTYFAANYNNATPGAEKWTGSILGTFSMATSNAPAGYNGTCQGNINAKFMIRDMNANGILDESEKFSIQYNTLDGRLSKPCAFPSTGEMACKTGSGALNSNGFAFTYPPSFNVLNGNGNLNLVTCPSAADPSTWGSVKSLFR
jgi:hypothetical protein